MVSIDLNNSQRTMLTTLVNKYQQTGEAVTGEKIAEEIDRNPGTVRNQMQSLTSLGLVEGIPGPTGGYKPTSEAFDAIDRQQLDEAESVVVAHDYERVDVTVEAEGEEWIAISSDTEFDEVIADVSLAEAGAEVRAEK